MGEFQKNKEQELIERIQRFRPIDDTFFQVLADDVGVCQEMLRVILQDEKLIVNSVKVQPEEHNLVGRSVRLDTLCVLGDGTLCNIEIQRADNDDHLRRMRYHASCITASETEPRTDFKQVPNVIVVYISEFDFLQGGRTIYHIDSVIREDNRIVDNGLQMICVNTKHDDGSDIAALMKCFLQSEVSDTRFPQMSQRMSYLKQSEGGRKMACKIVEEYAKEYAEEYAKEYAEEYAKEYAEERLDEYSKEKICNGIREGIEPLALVRIFNVPIDLIMSLKENLQS